MDYKIQSRIDNILRNDKINDPQSVCKILKNELTPILENFLKLNKEISVRFKTESNKNIIFIEAEAERIKPFGYIPY